MRLDKIDKKILALLDSDSRQSFSFIAKECSLSKERVRYRVRSYERSGLLQNFFAIINHSLLDIEQYYVLLKLRSPSPKNELLVVNFLRDELTVVKMFACEGKFEVAALVICKHPHELYNTLLKLKTELGPLILQKEIHQLVSFQRAPFADEQSNLPLIGQKSGEQQKPLHKLQKHLLERLSLDARLSSVMLSKELDVAAKTIAENIASLKQDGYIAGYGAHLNLTKIAWIKVLLNINLENIPASQTIITYFHKKSLLRFSYNLLGAYDLSLELWFENLEQYRKAIIDFKDSCNEHYTFFDVLFVLDEKFYGFKPYPKRKE